MALDQRTPAQLREHYEIEKSLADQLRNASCEERRVLYTSLYQEMYRRVPLHPQLVRSASPEETTRAVARQMKFLRRFLKPAMTFLEVGPGDCALALEMTRHAKRVYAVDVAEMVSRDDVPPNFHFSLTDGSSIDVPENSVDLAFSNQVMEHLHPDDAATQLKNIYKALAPGGIYACITPNRLSGPHDISVFFDPVATGFHLKEYTVTELSALFAEVGFVRIKSYLGPRRIYVRVPTFLFRWLEATLDALPPALRKRVARTRVVRALLSIIITGSK